MLNNVVSQGITTRQQCGTKLLYPPVSVIRADDTKPSTTYCLYVLTIVLPGAS